MGKRDHGRLVSEIRSALLRRGFEPSRVTRLETPEGARTVRSPGFKLERHSDSKSVRLSYRGADGPLPKATDLVSRQALGRARMKRLVGYNAPLEQEGFTCVGLDSRDPLAPYSLWRRASHSRQGGMAAREAEKAAVKAQPAQREAGPGGHLPPPGVRLEK